MKTRDFCDQQFDNCVCHESEWRLLEKEELATLVASTFCESLDEGDALYEEEDSCRGVYLVQRGLLSLGRIDFDGNVTLFGLAGPGETLGYQAIVEGAVYRETATALEPTRVFFISGEAFCELIGENPVLGMEFLRKAANDIAAANDRYHRAMTLPARARLAHRLLGLKERYGTVGRDGTIAIALPCSRRELASLIGVRPESISRTFGQLRDAGIASCSGRSVLIQDLCGLSNEAMGIETPVLDVFDRRPVSIFTDSAKIAEVG